MYKTQNKITWYLHYVPVIMSLNEKCESRQRKG
jgi:hypothetical protein